MSDLSRRQLLHTLAASVLAATSIDRLAARELHRHLADEQASAAGGPYTPKALNAHEFATLDRLTDLIIPADGSTPGARVAGAAPWIDSLAAENEQLKTIYVSGLAWLDQTIQAQGAPNFVSATEPQQKVLLDRLAYKKNQDVELAPGVRFFDWARRMTVDAFYTSRIGSEALGYRGNSFLPEFKVPAEVLQRMNARSPI